MTAPRFYLESLGCAKNQVDSEAMIASLTAAGLVRTNEAGEADLIVVNSCGFIRPAKEESIDTTLELRAAHPRAKIILAGCLTQRYEGELRRELPEVDGFTGNRDPADVAVLARELLGAALPPARPAGRRRRGGKRDLLSLPGSAYVKIAEGCDNHCTYCAIPLIRGELRSRAREEILSEVRTLTAQGIREINLVAQDLGSYGRDGGGPGIVELVESILELEGAWWLRLLYIHPDHVPDGLLDLPARDPRMVPYFDLPFQHAAKDVLRGMGRRGDARVYADLVRRIRDTVPGAVVRSTFLTGFPGETEDDFRALLAFQAEARLDWVGAFTYSREEGTAAAGLPGAVPAKVAVARRVALERAQVSITESALDTRVGAVHPVLLEERVPGERMYLGRAAFQAPEVDGSVVVTFPVGVALPAAGSVVPVRLTRRNGFDLEGLPT